MRIPIIKTLQWVTPRKWISGDYWLKVPIVRQACMRVGVLGSDSFYRENLSHKITALDKFLTPILRTTGSKPGFFWKEKKEKKRLIDQDPRHVFRQVRFIDSKKNARRKFFKRFWGKLILFITKVSRDFLVPSPEFLKKTRTHLLQASIDKKERYFSLDELVRIDKKILRAKKVKKIAKARLTFSRNELKSMKEFLSNEEKYNAYPESYLRFFFPRFKAKLFVKNKARYQLGRKKLFQIEEITAFESFLSRHIRLRDPASNPQQLIPIAKKWTLATLCAIIVLPLLFDLSILLYGTTKCKYIQSIAGKQEHLTSITSPYARRSNFIYKMNSTTNHDNFSFEGSVPRHYNWFTIDNDSRLSIELNYQFYKATRMQAQNGLSIMSLDMNKLHRLATENRDIYNKLVKSIIIKTWWEGALYHIDSLTNDFFDLFSWNSFSQKRLHRDFLAKFMNNPAPMQWINKLNTIAPITTILYHKPNTKKWIDLDDVPPLMIEAVILREDRRFRNDVFPIPHRGNDNLVIVPLIFKKVNQDINHFLYEFAKKYDLPTMEKIFENQLESIDDQFKDAMRGGSTISNQVVEMLYTRNIPQLIKGNSGISQKIEQKKYELPASSTLDWFWTEDEMLETYVNEVYGGHLHGDIRGFRSQAELYFSKNLKDLNLRELMLLVGTVKKPSRIKDYALWLKSRELKALIDNSAKTRGLPLSDWEEENAVYKINRTNYTRILTEKKKKKEWVDIRTNNILMLLMNEGHISEDEYTRALNPETVHFQFAPDIITYDTKLHNNIRKEVNQELGTGRSDSGIAMITTVDDSMQKKVQKLINRVSRTISVDSEYSTGNQPSRVRLDGGARIVKANSHINGSEDIVIYNRILADIGGSSRINDEWDWITQANRSLGSSLKPILDLYFLLKGYNLNDMLRDSKTTYRSYSLEQEKIYENYIFKHPKKWDDIAEIKENWYWTPRNYKSFSGNWVTVEHALINSINSVHVKIQEILTPEIFSRLLNEFMNITIEKEKHKPYRSIILGGSNGNQRYDSFLMAFSFFANKGIIQKSTYINTIMLPDGTSVQPAYKPIPIPLLEKFDKDYVQAACLLINKALRKTVTEGSMNALRDIGAGKTGTSNNLKDALASLHLRAGNSTYIVGVRLGNRRNYSIGRAAHQVAAPLAKKIVNSVFEDTVLPGEQYDAALAKQLDTDPNIVQVKNNYYLKGNEKKSRHLSVSAILKKMRSTLLREASEHYISEDYHSAAIAYERFLKIASRFDSKKRAFHSMVTCYIHLGNLNRAKQLIERFSQPKQMRRLVLHYERQHKISLKVDTRLYKKRTLKIKKKEEKKKEKEADTEVKFADSSIKNSTKGDIIRNKRSEKKIKQKNKKN